jgi:hypothetical protein
MTFGTLSMQVSASTWWWALVAIWVASLVLWAANVAIDRRAWRRLTAMTSHESQALRIELEAIQQRLVVLGAAFEARIAQVEHRPNAVNNDAPGVVGNAPLRPSSRDYESAARLARNGATVKEIVASCGTTRAEAELLRRLHHSAVMPRAVHVRR